MTDVASAHPEASATAGAPADAAKQYTGVHSFMVNACKFVVDTKYAPLKPLGRGAYGVVCSAMDKSQQQEGWPSKRYPKHSTTSSTQRESSGKSNSSDTSDMKTSPHHHNTQPDTTTH